MEDLSCTPNHFHISSATLNCSSARKFGRAYQLLEMPFYGNQPWPQMLQPWLSLSVNQYIKYVYVNNGCITPAPPCPVLPCPAVCGYCDSSETISPFLFSSVFSPLLSFVLLLSCHLSFLFYLYFNYSLLLSSSP